MAVYAKFSSDKSRWWLTRLSVVPAGLALLAFFHWLSGRTGENYMAGGGMMVVLLLIVLYQEGFFRMHRLIIRYGEVRSGKERFHFPDVVDVHREKKRYVFFLSDGKRVRIPTYQYSRADREKIDSIFAEEFLSNLSRPGAAEKIAAAYDNKEHEFSVRAQFSAVFSVYIGSFTAFMAVFGGITAIIILTDLFSADGQVNLRDFIPFSVCLGVWLVGMIIELSLPRDVFSFRDNVFTVVRNGKEVVSLPFGSVTEAKVVIARNTFKLEFRTRESRKPVTVEMRQFARKDREMIEEKVRALFSLPPSRPADQNVI
ncbi:MAG: hypothetical protein LIO85_02755 [Rikenellaceae bacterium]|nr:hypothetical protein [Rikenellaceae bacterium]